MDHSNIQIVRFLEIFKVYCRGAHWINETIKKERIRFNNFSVQ